MNRSDKKCSIFPYVLPEISQLTCSKDFSGFVEFTRDWSGRIAC